MYTLYKRKFNAPPKQEVKEIPSDIKEAFVMLGAVEKLTKRKNELLAQIDNLNLEISGIDTELLTYKPLLAHMKGLTSAVQAVKDSVRKVN
jgi:uncharacterized protein YoxC